MCFSVITVYLVHKTLAMGIPDGIHISLITVLLFFNKYSFLQYKTKNVSENNGDVQIITKLRFVSDQERTSSASRCYWSRSLTANVINLMFITLLLLL